MTNFSLHLKPIYNYNLGYENLRKWFTLPTQKSLNNQIRAIECEEGFLFKVLEQIKRDLDNDKYGPECILSLDEMAVKKGLVWDTGLHTFGGQTTVIEGIGCQEKKLASKVLVFMLKGLEQGERAWEKPIAYFFTADSTTSFHLSQYVKEALRLTFKSSILVRGIVCDGPAVNQQMLSTLGSPTQ